MRFKAASLISAAILSLGGGLVAATPANADASWCPQGKLCFFPQTNFQNEVYVADSLCALNFNGEDYPGFYPNVADTASSVVNNSDFILRLHQDNNHGGKYIYINGHSQIADLTKGQLVYNHDGSLSSQTGFNDVISSVWSTTC